MEYNAIAANRDTNLLWWVPEKQLWSGILAFIGGVGRGGICREKFATTVNCPGHSHGQTNFFSQLHDGADQGFKFHGTSGLKILQHRSLVFSDFFRAGHSL